MGTIYKYFYYVPTSLISTNVSSPSTTLVNLKFNSPLTVSIHPSFFKCSILKSSYFLEFNNTLFPSSSKSKQILLISFDNSKGLFLESLENTKVEPEFL